MDEMRQCLRIYQLQVILAISILTASQGFCLDSILQKTTAVTIARFCLYLLIIKGCEEAIQFAYQVFLEGENIKYITEVTKYKKSILQFVACLVVLWFFEQKIVIGIDLLYLALSRQVLKYPGMKDLKENKSVFISYGRGMACSFFEGYLTNIIPPDGQGFQGFIGAINLYESNHKVVFPVKRLFLVIVKSLHCPPNLEEFNIQNRKDLPYLERCESLEDVIKSVAGVKDRIYRNSAYKIHRPGKRLVYLAVECASPMHTMHKVMNRKALYEELQNADFAQIQTEFCEMLVTILNKSPDCRNKCELVYYDDTNPKENLAEILLHKIEEIEPNFDEIQREIH